MPELPASLYRAAQTRELDRLAIAAGTPGYELMCRAGAAAWRRLRQHWPEARRIVVLAGPGNNGGDGYVLARLARAEGMAVALLTVGDHGRLPGDAARAAEALAGQGVQAFVATLPEADVYVDALLGTGLNKPASGDMATVIRQLNMSGRPVLALDMPSGLAADTGAELGEAVRASVTVSFIGLKIGLLTGRGPACTGLLHLEELDVPAAVYHSQTPAARCLRAGDLSGWLPSRSRDAHKGSHGHVLVVGGDHGMAGAVAMAAEAAQRSGAGLVSVATRPGHAAIITGRRPEIMVRGVETADELEPLLARASVVVVGPGLGQAEWGRALWLRVMASGLPLLADADALNLLARQPLRHAGWVLTPHPGEAARLLGCDIATVEADRPAAARQLQQRFGGVAVLKGAGSLVATENGLGLCPYGNPGMGTGGMGDVLSGVIGAMLAQGLPAADAAAAGVLVHALAGDDAAAALGERGLAATDLFSFLHRRVNPCQSWT